MLPLADCGFWSGLFRCRRLLRLPSCSGSATPLSALLPCARKGSRWVARLSICSRGLDSTGPRRRRSSTAFVSAWRGYHLMLGNVRWWRRCLGSDRSSSRSVTRDSLRKKSNVCVCGCGRIVHPILPRLEFCELKSRSLSRRSISYIWATWVRRMSGMTKRIC